MRDDSADAKVKGHHVILTKVSAVDNHRYAQSLSHSG
jgi:hypothetical protein